MKLQVLKIRIVDPGSIDLRKSLEELRADAAFPEVFASIRDRGFIEPALVDPQLAIVDGAHRLAAALDLDLAEVPVVVLDREQVDTWWNSLLLIKSGGSPGSTPLLNDLRKLGALTGVGNGPGASARYVYEGPRSLTLAFYLTLVCDGGCPYCYWPEKPTAHPAIDVAATAAKLEELRRDRPVRLQLWGGEPTLHPQFEELCRAVSPWADDILVTSNGACGPELFARSLRTYNATVSLSYHPNRLELAAHLATFERLLELGFDVHATAVRWPGHKDQLRAWATIMRDRWPSRYRLLDCWLEGKRRFLEPDDLGEFRGEPGRPARWRSPKGQTCAAGRDFAAVLFHDGGRIVRCLAGRQLRGDVWPQLELLEAPAPCADDEPCACRLMHQYWN